VTPALYPLLLDARLDTKIWGGRRLETVLGKRLPAGERVGESLETDDSSKVRNGPLRGSRLGDVVSQHGVDLLGTLGLRASQAAGGFPLLAKFIDASDTLSVQVHPDDERAAPLGKRGKTEAWHVLVADTGARLIVGVSTGASKTDLATAIQQNRLEDLMLYEPVRTGDTLIIPAGTTHAIGGGILLYEIQQASDVTYRMYDWGRVDDHGNPRDLHVEESIAVVDPALRALLIEPLALDNWRAVLTACRYFTLERWTVHRAFTAPSIERRSFRILSCIRGACEIRGAADPVSLSAGETAVLPAAL
jgi:mannose-6-phosphate isomerase